MNWLQRLWAWLTALLQPKPAWSQSGNTLTGTITGGLVDTSRPIVDSSTHPHTWTVSSNKQTISTNLG